MPDRSFGLNLAAAEKFVIVMVAVVVRLWPHLNPLLSVGRWRIRKHRYLNYVFLRG